MHIPMLEREIDKDIAWVEDHGGYGSTDEQVMVNVKRLCQQLHLLKLLKWYKHCKQMETVAVEVIENPATGETLIVEKKTIVPPAPSTV